MRKPDTARYTPEPSATAAPDELLGTLLLVHERLVSDRLAGLAAAARRESEATQRALSGILLDTLEEREELEQIRAAWTGDLAGERAPASRMQFRDRIESFLEAKRVMARRYRALAAAAPDPHTAKRLRRLGERAAEHAAILLSLLGD